MVDSIQNGPVSTLLRAQSAGLSAGVQAPRASQPIIDQVANGAPPSTVQQPAKIAAAKEDLPRGSLVDILV